MSRGRAPFTQSDVTRALRAVIAAGVNVSRVEIEPTTGRIVISAGGTDDEQSKPTTPLQAWKRKHAHARDC